MFQDDTLYKLTYLLTYSKVKFCSLAYELASTQCRATFIQVTLVNPRNGIAINDSTMNIILMMMMMMMIIIIIIIKGLSLCF